MRLILTVNFIHYYTYSALNQGGRIYCNKYRQCQFLIYSQNKLSEHYQFLIREFVKMDLPKIILSRHLPYININHYCSLKFFRIFDILRYFSILLLWQNHNYWYNRIIKKYFILLSSTVNISDVSRHEVLYE